MTAQIRSHLRSNVVGYIALFCFAISGTAQALPGSNTVDSGDIKNFQVKKKDLGKNSVAGTNVIDGSLTAADLDPSALKAIFATGVVSSVQLADGTIIAADLADGSVTTPKLASQAVTAPKLADAAVGTEKLETSAVTTPKLAEGAVTAPIVADNAINSSHVANNSLTGSDLAGADATGSVSFSGVSNGRCNQVTINVSGAAVGDLPLVSTGEAIQNGIVLYAQRVESAGHVEADICNFSGTAMTAISGLPIHVMTFR